jgi:DedD protein
MAAPLELSGFMGFFSFGKKDDAPRRRGASASSARSGGASEVRDGRRSRRSERAGDADAMLLDPTLPEKQRARRRLVGAIALVVAAVVILPMVLDSHPKPVTDDIAIDIPNRPATASSRTNEDNPQDTQAGVAPDRADVGDAASGAASAAGAASASASASAVNPGKAAQQSAAGAQTKLKQSESKQAGAPSATATRSNGTQPGAKPAPVPAPSPAQADSGTPAAPAGARFAVRLGVFADDASARAWEAKLKAAGVPAYTEHRKQADGKTRTMLQAGPFADRAAASAAIAKVREAGLTAGATGGGAQ